MKRGLSGLSSNQKGLSAIIATLLIILLTLVAVGIIWVVIRNVVQGGAEQIDLSAKCTAVSLSAVTVTESSPGSGNYSITLRRDADDEGDLGVKVNVFAGTSSGGVQDWGSFGGLDALGTATNNVNGPASADKIEYTPFFQDASRNDQICPGATRTFSF